MTKEFPDMALTMKKLKIAVELEKVRMPTVLGHAVWVGIKEKRLPEVIEMIQEYAKNDYSGTAWVIGKQLLKDIMSLEQKTVS